MMGAEFPRFSIVYWEIILQLGKLTSDLKYLKHTKLVKISY